MLMMNIIFAVFCYPILPIMYFVLRNATKPKKNMILYVTLPYAARRDESVLAICRSFRRHLGVMSLILTAALAGPFFIGYFSIALTYHMTWLCAVIIAPFFSYAKYHGKLKRLKHGKNWEGEATGKVLLDTKAALQPPAELNPLLFIPPVILSLAPVAHAVYTDSDPAFTITFIINALLVVSFYFFYRALYRQRSEVIDENTALGITLTRIRQHHWCKVWMGLSWFTGLFNVLVWLFISNFTGMIISTAVYTFAVMYVAINAEFSVRKAQEKLTESSGQGLYADSDEHWIIGMFYFNPNDNHTMINARFGIGMTVNLARPAGKVLMIFALLSILAMPFAGAVLIPGEFTPVRIELSDSSILAYHTSLVYEVRIDDVHEIVLLDALPSGRRVAGTAFDTLLKGRFRMDGIGTGLLCLNPQVPPFMLIITEETAYIFGTNEAESTHELYGLLGYISHPVK